MNRDYTKPVSNKVNYFFNNETMDLAKIRKEAEDITKSGEKVVTIHHHKLATRCPGHSHNDYKNGTEVFDVVHI